MNRTKLKESAKNKLANKWTESVKIILTLIVINIITILISLATTVLFYTVISNTYNEELKEIYATVADISSIIVTALVTFGYYSFFLKISRKKEVTYRELFSKPKLWLKFLGFSLLTIIIVVLGLCCLIIPGIIIALGITQTVFIILDNPEINVIDAMRESYNMMKGHKLEYFILQFSFLGWIILCVFTLGIGLLWLIPYMEVTNANFYNELKKAE